MKTKQRRITVDVGSKKNSDVGVMIERYLEVHPGSSPTWIVAHYCRLGLIHDGFGRKRDNGQSPRKAQSRTQPAMQQAV